jgi:heptosyltransferase-3
LTTNVMTILGTKNSVKSERILIYRLGSIGDFVVALPCLNLIRRCFPSAQIALLTSRARDSRAAAAQALLAGSGLIQQFIEYPLGTRRYDDLRAVRRAVSGFRPDKIIYLSEPRRISSLVRDYFFFRFCSAGEITGLPLARDLRRIRPPQSADGIWESEASRLARCVATLGDAAIADPENWSMHLTAAEHAEANLLLGAPDRSNGSFVAFSAGTKQADKDWGDANWRKVLAAIGGPETRLVLIGSADEAARMERLAQSWKGPVINLCGKASPRVSAAVMQRARFFLGHDSGPMHLAASVGTRCIAVFSAQSPPGQWYPAGNHHVVFFPPAAQPSISAISPDDVISAASRFWRS